ncbi:unnamed protein product [Cuscuta epithymum]|uniref:Uncharacterized protein n=1 Tax=Cuscuta epithymum TaxID=186058 RepID=A0AAV0G036_9ASTE|nr:unnamed protein product [Cuscuta epithymum]
MNQTLHQHIIMALNQLILNAGYKMHTVTLCSKLKSQTSLAHNYDGGILGSVPPPIVCQICFSTGHSALACPSRFSQPSAPALMTNSGETNSALWYPDSGASAHMTTSDGQNLGSSTSSGFQ